MQRIDMVVQPGSKFAEENDQRRCLNCFERQAVIRETRGKVTEASPMSYPKFFVAAWRVDAAHRSMGRNGSSIGQRS